LTPDTTLFLELLERRITLLGSLADALIAARADVASFDLDGLESRIAAQEHLCGEVRSLDANIDQVQRHRATQISASRESAQTASQPGDLRVRETLDRLRAAQVSVKRLNDAHQHLLRRSRRTVWALLNSYRTFAMTYSDPAAVRTSIGERI
jgi:hypothetical protein